MFGPLTSSTCSASSGGSGATSIAVFTLDSRRQLERRVGDAEQSGRSRGSVIAPVSADAAAVSGRAQVDRVLAVPERPGKLRGMVRRLLPPARRRLAHADAAHAARPGAAARRPRSGRRCAHLASGPARICREVGLTSKDTRRWVCRPSTIAAAIAKSRSPGFADEPITHLVDLARRRPRAPAPRCRAELGSAISGSSVRQVDLLVDVVGRVRRRRRSSPKSSSRPSRAQEVPHRVVGREHRGGGAQLGAHVGDDVPVHRGQPRRARGRGTR